ncbi:MAG: 4-diphosphocytidyl-2-C-methyl-D-erythritol kinase, partial [Actinomycetota bacterium]
MPKPKRVVVRAAAKVNLALKVGAVQADGFHPVETLYQAVDLFDEITATRADGLALEFTGVGAEKLPTDSTNLAWRAAELLAAHAGIDPNVNLAIHKEIPLAGGMAGGSADAAGTLVACDLLWGLQTPKAELLEIAAKLGSDIPFAVVGGMELGRGRGDELTTVLNRGEFHWVFVLSGAGLSTPAVYKEFDRLQLASDEFAIPAELLLAVAAGEVKLAARYFENDLQDAALSLRPDLRRVIEAGIEAGAWAGIVSGSGPTVAFLAKSANAALDLSIELQGSGLVT